MFYFQQLFNTAMSGIDSGGATTRHYAEGRLDEVEFKNRLDTAMSATTRGDLNGLFDDLPRLTSEPAPPPPRHRRVLPWILVVAVVAIAACASMPFFPLFHVPWLLVAIVCFFVWRRAGGHLGGPHHHRHHHQDGGHPSSVMDH